MCGFTIIIIMLCAFPPFASFIHERQLLKGVYVKLV